MTTDDELLAMRREIQKADDAARRAEDERLEEEEREHARHQQELAVHNLVDHFVDELHGDTETAREYLEAELRNPDETRLARSLLEEHRLRILRQRGRK